MAKSKSKTSPSPVNDNISSKPTEKQNDEKKKVIIVIDEANLDFAIEKLSSAGRRLRIDFENFAKLLVADDTCVGMYFVSKRAAKNTSFHKFLEKTGYEIIAPLDKIENGDPWDDQKIIEMLPQWSKDADKVVLTSGDKHFAVILKKLATQGKEVQIVGVKEMVSIELKQFTLIDLRLIKDKIILKDIAKSPVSKAEVTVQISFTATLPAIWCPPMIKLLLLCIDKIVALGVKINNIKIPIEWKS